MRKMKKKNLRYNHTQTTTRNIFGNSFNYEIGVMLPEKFIESNTDVQEQYIGESDIIQNDLNGKKFLD
jgi:hypothetical protein